MYPEPTNLLPEDKVRAFRRRYFFNFLTLAASLAVVLVIIHGILLIPTHLLLSAEVEANEATLTQISESATSTDEAAFAGKLAALSKNIDRIKALSAAPSATDLFSNVLALPRPGITIGALSFTAASGKRLPTVLLSGTATTRDTLRNYQAALQAAPFSQSADLPISTYAKDSNIPFTITITLKTP